MIINGFGNLKTLFLKGESVAVEKAFQTAI